MKTVIGTLFDPIYIQLGKHATGTIQQDEKLNWSFSFFDADNRIHFSTDTNYHSMMKAKRACYKMHTELVEKYK